MPKTKDPKVSAGGTIDSGLTKMLKKLSSGKAEDQLPSMPSPIFDNVYGKGFKPKKKKSS